MRTRPPMAMKCLEIQCVQVCLVFCEIAGFHKYLFTNLYIHSYYQVKGEPDVTSLTAMCAFSI